MKKALITILYIVCVCLMSCGSIGTSSRTNELDGSNNTMTEKADIIKAEDTSLERRVTAGVQANVNEGQPSVAIDGIHHEMYYAIEMSFIEYFIGEDEFYNNFIAKFGSTRDNNYRGICEYYGITKDEYIAFWEDMRDDFNASYLSETYDFEELFPLETKYDIWFSDDYETASEFIADDISSDIKIGIAKSAAKTYISDKRESRYTFRYYTIDSMLIDYVGEENFNQYLSDEDVVNIVSFLSYFDIDMAAYLEIYKDCELYPYNPEYLFADDCIEAIFKVNADRRVDATE